MQKQTYVLDVLNSSEDIFSNNSTFHKSGHIPNPSMNNIIPKTNIQTLISSQQRMTYPPKSINHSFYISGNKQNVWTYFIYQHAPYFTAPTPHPRTIPSEGVHWRLLYSSPITPAVPMWRSSCSLLSSNSSIRRTYEPQRFWWSPCGRRPRRPAGENTRLSGINTHCCYCYDNGTCYHNGGI